MYFLGVIIESRSLDGHNLDNDMQYYGSFYICITKAVHLFAISEMFYIQLNTVLFISENGFTFKKTHLNFTHLSCHSKDLISVFDH